MFWLECESLKHFLVKAIVRCMRSLEAGSDFEHHKMPRVDFINNKNHCQVGNDHEGFFDHGPWPDMI